MFGKPTLIERAFELAGAGTCTKVSQIVDTLVREGYRDAKLQLEGRSIRQQLRGLISRSASNASEPQQSLGSGG
jgi:hypothetical protein